MQDARDLIAKAPTSVKVNSLDLDRRREGIGQIARSKVKFLRRVESRISRNQSSVLRLDIPYFFRGLPPERHLDAS